MTKFLTALTAAAVSVACLSTAFAEPGPGKGHEGMDRQPPMPAFEDLDTNGDGMLSTDELTAARAERVQTLDADGDGKLSADELAQAEIDRATKMAERHAQMMVERMDADGDGLLSAAELATPPARPSDRMLDRLDANDDGSISQDEFDAARDGMRDRHPPQHDGKRGDHPGGKPPQERQAD
ncbi:EF-hand domain-containing protein [Falsirhodobacter algicola]|uniref:Calcium-binding protein n=1 Tax=Falsirhodobacter algicola TaxID=2692330 RepID=A0A8J8MR73_9RHOB|nr:EF-hand domain-containing protein [Falsirhodobacter algicola]QUS34793.1 calcium-binding protein [Falsirhodobacter algicola]